MGFFREHRPVIGIVAVALVLYAAYQAYEVQRELAAYRLGDQRRSQLADVVRLADSYDVASDPRYQQVLRDAEKTGRIDVKRLSEILVPIAKETGDLVRLQSMLDALANGAEIPEEPAASRDAKPRAAREAPASAKRPPAERQAPAERQPQPIRTDQTAVIKVSGDGAVTGPAATSAPAQPPAPLPEPWWDVTSPADPARWAKAVPGWAGRGMTVGRAGSSLDGVPITLWGRNTPGYVPLNAFTSADADERELARLVLTANAQEIYRARFGRVGAPAPGSPTMPEFMVQLAKDRYRDRAAIVLTSR